ncbi:MAG: DUF4956 domain-containing protein [Planctomycetota bacterium]|jgi:hypothetical protein
MNELGQQVFGDIAAVSAVTSYELIIALASSTVLTLLLAKLYMVTHGGYSYSKSFLQTIVLVGVTVALIMIIIGSDIARAFALVGAMSIVRFRTPVKDARDLVFVFAAIAIGMACGTQFHIFAAIFTVFVAGLVLTFYYWGFGELPNKGYVVKMRIKGSDKDRVADLCGQLCKRYSIVSISRSNGDDVEDVIYEVELKRGVAYKDLLERLTKAIQPESVNVLVGEGNVNA